MSEATNLKFNVITAISNSDHEESVAALLHTQGCNIVYRALDLPSLDGFLNDCLLEVSIIISKDFISVEDFMRVSNKYNNYKFIQSDSENIDFTYLVTELSKISKPLFNHKLLRSKNLTTVIGSPGSPGVSTITNHLAVKLSATIIAAHHQNLRPKTSSKVITVRKLEEEISKHGSNRLLIDGGSATLLTTILADRRQRAQWLNESVAFSSNLLYIVNSDDNGINYLEQFTKDFINLINPPKIIYILNKQRFDRSGQLIQRQFLELTTGFESNQVPFDLRAQRLLSNTNKRLVFWQSDTFSKQINKIGVQLG